MADDPVQTDALRRGRPAEPPIDPTGDQMLARLRATLFAVDTGAVAPTRIGRFEIVETLGAGGMGVVYVGLDPVLARRVAIKLVRSPEPAAHARLLAEARALARLAHPNIVAIHEAGAIDEQVYLAIELVDGDTLRRWGERDWRAVVRVYADVARGLAFAHAAGVVHGDVKPDNLVIGREDGRVRVIDFGLADATTGGGTPGYMAPEIVDGGPLSEAGDQYAFCVALHEALLGCRPGGEPRARAPRRLRAIVARGLSPDAARRHPSMAALAGALVAALRPRRARIAAVAIAAAVATGVGVTVVATSSSTSVAAAASAPGIAAPAAPSIAATPAPSTAAPPMTMPPELVEAIAKIAVARAQTPPDRPVSPPARGSKPRRAVDLEAARAKAAAAKATWDRGDHRLARARGAEARAMFQEAGAAGAADLAAYDRWEATRAP